MNPFNSDVPSRTYSKLRCSESRISKVEARSSKRASNVSYGSDRLNRDDSGERSEHTSPVSGIITLFRSKQRYSVARLRSRAIPLRSPGRPFPLLVRSAYFLSAKTYHLASPFFHVENNFALSNRSIGFPTPSPRVTSKDFPANVTLLRLVAFTEHFILRTSTALVFSSFFYTLFRREGKDPMRSGQIARRSSKPG